MIKETQLIVVYLTNDDFITDFEITLYLLTRGRVTVVPSTFLFVQF